MSICVTLPQFFKGLRRNLLDFTRFDKGLNSTSHCYAHRHSSVSSSACCHVVCVNTCATSLEVKVKLEKTVFPVHALKAYKGTRNLDTRWR